MKNEFQTKLHEAFQQAQNKATARAKEFEQEARKVLETLGDRAQAELKTLLQTARDGSREQMGILGAGLEKLGKRLQELAAAPAAKPAADDNATQTPPASVQ
jgi:vacuolar-type H+-ATPase subunit H